MVSASGEARAEREGGSRTEMSDLNPGRTVSRNTPTGWISGFSSFSTWCCSSSCTSCPDCFTETSRMWPLERILNTTNFLNKEDFQLPNSRPLTSP